MYSIYNVHVLVYNIRNNILYNYTYTLYVHAYTCVVQCTCTCTVHCTFIKSFEDGWALDTHKTVNVHFCTCSHVHVITINEG